jgi:hypothetical protein
MQIASGGTRPTHDLTRSRRTAGDELLPQLDATGLRVREAPSDEVV